MRIKIIRESGDVKTIDNSRFESVFYSDGTESGYANKILLTFDTTVTNFTFYKLEGTVDEEGNYVCTSMQELYRQPTITENDLTVVETELGELLPIRAISFCDAGGNTGDFPH